METLHHYIGVVRKWWLLILLGTVLGAVGAYAITARMTPMYRSSSLLIVDNVEDPVAPRYQDVQMNQRQIETYAERLVSRPVLEAVSNELELGIGPNQLRSQIVVTPLLDTSLIRLSVQDADPTIVVMIANKIPEVFNTHDQSLQQAQFAELRTRYSDQMAAITGDIKNTQTQIRQIGDTSNPENQIALDQLQANLSAYRSNYATLLTKYGELRLAEAGRRASITVDQPAALPRAPFPPNVQRNTMLGGVAGLAIVLVIASMLTYLDDTVRTREDLPNAISVETFGPQTQIRSLNGHGVGAPTLLLANDTAATEIIRSLMRLIQFNEFGGVGVVTSLLFATPSSTGETSRLVADVALTLAQSGRATLVIDCDLEQPSLHTAFDLRPEKGMAEALREARADGESSRPEDYLVATTHPNLKILLAGEHRADDKFDLANVGLLISQLSHNVDVLLLKGSGVLDDRLTAFLSQQVDATVVVADAGRTRRRDIAESVHQLEQAGARVLGTVLYRPSNGSTARTPTYGTST